MDDLKKETIERAEPAPSAMTPQDERTLRAWSVEYGYTDLRELPEAGWCCIARFLFTYAILSGLSDFYYEDRWCFSSYEKAKAALDAWDGTGEPTGWHRHPKTGRRVAENGDMYIAH